MIYVTFNSQRYACVMHNTKWVVEHDMPKRIPATLRMLSVCNHFLIGLLPFQNAKVSKQQQSNGTSTTSTTDSTVSIEYKHNSKQAHIQKGFNRTP